MALPAIGLLGLAQAAAVLIAIGVGGRSHHTPQTNQSTESREPAHSTRSVVHFASPITIEEGHLVVIREEGQPHELQLPVFLSRFTLVPISVEGPALKVVDMTPDGISVAVDDWYVMFNAVEWIDRPVVAMKE